MDGLIAKYFFDELNQEEERQLLDWIAENPENAEQFVHSKKLLTLAESENQVFNPNADDAWARIQEKINAEKSAFSLVKAENKSPIIQLMRIAAGFLILFGVSYGISKLDVFQKSSQRDSMVATQVQDADDVVEIVTGNEVKVIYLPDSSLVFLNRNSRIIYSQHFGVDKRNIYLEGESFFDVKP
ncbi:MAG: FecR domain-containing protein, partial [Flavobacteriales bacterium]|nr:FecR domain-containing protein [Flavobacteriales bacterium]